MGLFKSKEDEAAAAAADKAAADAAAAATAEPKYVTEEQFKAMGTQLDGMARTLENLQTAQPAYQQPAAPAAAPVDPHKEAKDRIVAIDTQLQDLTKKADEAAYAGKGMGEVMSQQQRLMAERSTLVGQTLIPTSDARMDAGIQTLDALSTEITSGKMPHLTLPEVKNSYERYIGQLAPEQRMNPQAKMGAYNLAVGENLPKIEESQKQVWLREAEETATQDAAAGSHSGRDAGSGTSGATPAPDAVLSADALKSIKGSRHRTPENYYRSLGYEGWDDYYEKNKEYLEEEGE